MTYIEMCLSGKAESKYWKEWVIENKDKITPQNELLGLNKEEYDDLLGNIRSFDFYLFKRKHEMHINKLWPGCYIKFAYELDLNNPHFEYGWVDMVSNEKGFCKVQCDDNFNGNRALTIRIIDIVEIMPFKERPLIYYKTMLCGSCNDCDRISVELPPDSCKFIHLFNALLNKQKADNEFIKAYNMVKENTSHLNQCSCEKCNGKCEKNT